MIRHLGLLRYVDALKEMEAAHAEVCQDPSHEGIILLVEHPPVVTMGLRPTAQDMLVNAEFLATKGIDFAKIDRGGSVTVHEPGQVVIYPIVRIDPMNLTVRAYVEALEEAMIRLCAAFGVTAVRDPINAGVWVGSNKIGAVGIRVLQRVSKHGVAFNVTNSLDTFRWIVPCGLQTRGVTTLSKELLAQGRASCTLDFSTIALQLAELIQEEIGKRR